MLTTKPLSTISYNTEYFLVDTLQRLTKSHILVEWYYIFHKGEIDENGIEEKNHYHVYLQPNKRVDTEELRDLFIEPCFECPDKPLKCMPFKVSKIDDWLLYGIHLDSYLQLKGLTRQYHYSINDVRCSEPEFLERVFKHALESISKDFVKRSNMLKMGVFNAYSSGYASNDDVRTLSIVMRMEDVEKKRDISYNQLKNDYDKLYVDYLELLDKTRDNFIPIQLSWEDIK